jgi:hypothetical protein
MDNNKDDELKPLWKILPFQSKRKNKARGNKIEAKFWKDFGDFLTNGSNGVNVTLAQNSPIPEIEKGDIVIFDENLRPKRDSIVVISAGGGLHLRKYESSQEVFAVVIAIVKLTDDHRRQRER